MKQLLSLLPFLLAPLLAQPATYTIDPAQSSITVAGALAGLTIDEQGPGSLSTTYSGTIDAILGSNSIAFSNTTLITAANSGNWSPSVTGAAGTAPANYGIEASGPVPPGVPLPTLPIGTIDGLQVDTALRNLQLRMASSNLTIDAAGNLPGDQIEIETVQMDVAVLVSAVVTIPFLGQTIVPVTNFTFAITNTVATNQNPSSSLVTTGGLEVLTIDVTSLLQTTAVVSNDTSFSLTGQIVATRPAPMMTTNTPPTIAAIPSITVDAGSTAMVSATASDPDAGQTLTFSLAPGNATGAVISTNGVFSWITPLMPASTSETFTVWVTDDGAPPLSNSTSFTVNLRTNSAPSIAALPLIMAVAGSTVSVSVVASDPDAGQTLSYSLDPGAPAGATISATGVFTWITSTNDAFTTVGITVRVSDDGSPPKDATTSFTIALAGPPLILDLRLIGGSWELDLVTMPGFGYDMEQSLDILPASWSTAGSATATGAVHTLTVPMPAMDQQMFRALLP